MSNEINVPELRFDGFSGKWDVAPFSESFSFLSSNTLSRAELNYEGGKARNIHYGDILVKFGDVIDAQGTDIPYISSDELVSKMSATKLQDGDILFADAAEDESVGKCIEVTNVGEETVFSGLHTIATRPNQFFGTNYLGYYLNSGSFHHQLLPLMQGTKVLSISKKSISKVDVKYPSDSLEQGDIGNYFQKLDTLINQHQQKHDKLSNLKKAMLEKMFPKAGETVPEIRFEGFSGEWEERSWRDTVDISTKMVDPRDSQYGELFHVGPGNIESFTGRLYDNILKVRESNLISGKFHFNKGDIIYGKINPQLAKYVIAPFEGLASADAYVLSAKNGVVQSYLFTIIHSEDFYKYSVSVSSRTGMPKINRDELNIFSYMAPNEQEQNQIGNYFQKLDALISQHSQQITKLKNIKQACLNKMFV